MDAFTHLCIKINPYSHQTSNISGTLVGSKTVDHSDVVGASSVQLHPHSRLHTWLQ